MLSERDVTSTFKSEFNSLFPALRLEDWAEQQPPTPDGYRPDAEFRIVTSSQRSVLCMAESKARGAPSLLQGAAAQIQRLTAGSDRYPVVIAPYVTDRGRRLLSDFGVGYFDLAGNCLIQSGDVYISIEGKPNRYPEQVSVESVFEGKAERVVRLLLENAARSWTQREMSTKARISLGYANRIVQALVEELWVEKMEGGGFRLMRADELLDAWREAYSPDRSRATGLYVMDGTEAVRQYLARRTAVEQGTYALTLFAAADLLAPYTTSSRLDFYFAGDLGQLAKDLDAREVPTGATCTAFRPYDEFVLYGARVIQGYSTVSPLQAYLDLHNLGGRAREQAEHLRESQLQFPKPVHPG